MEILVKTNTLVNEINLKLDKKVNIEVVSLGEASKLTKGGGGSVPELFGKWGR